MSSFCSPSANWKVASTSKDSDREDSSLLQAMWLSASLLSLVAGYVTKEAESELNQMEMNSVKLESIIIFHLGLDIQLLGTPLRFRLNVTFRIVSHNSDVYISL